MENEQTNPAAAILIGAISNLEALTISYTEAERFNREAARNLCVRTTQHWKHEEAADAAYHSLNEIEDSGLLEELEALLEKLA